MMMDQQERWGGGRKRGKRGRGKRKRGGRKKGGGGGRIERGRRK